jgi:hypothetical protein
MLGGGAGQVMTTATGADLAEGLAASRNGSPGAGEG